MKTTAHLAQLVIADLAKLMGRDFKFPDRLTWSEAAQVRAWARKQPQVRAAMQDRHHAGHESVRLFAGVVDHFSTDHPQARIGEPAPWQGGRVLPMDAPITEMTAEEAAARLAWARTTPDYQDAYYNPRHPEHSDYVAATQRLLEVSNGGQAGSIDAASPAGVSAPPSAEALARIAALQKDPAYRDGRHPDHQAAVAAVTAAYQAAYPSPLGGQDAGRAAVPPATTDRQGGRQVPGQPPPPGGQVSAPPGGASRSAPQAHPSAPGSPPDRSA